MLKLINSGISQAEVAREFGVTRAAISKRLKDIRCRTSKAAQIIERAPESINAQFDAMHQLNQINQKSLDILDRAESEADEKMMLRCIGEIRSQIKLAADIQLGLFSTQDTHLFMTIIIDSLKEATPEGYAKFKQLLHDQRSLRAALQLD